MLDAVCGRCQVKASGGINTYADACHYLDMGCTRIGRPIPGIAAMNQVLENAGFVQSQEVVSLDGPHCTGRQIRTSLQPNGTYFEFYVPEGIAFEDFIEIYAERTETFIDLLRRQAPELLP